MSAPVLQLENVESFYGASQALFGVDMTIGHGEVVTLMGRNGMGKTTTVRSIMGLIRPKRGIIRIDGQDVTGWPSYKIARLGIGYVPEGRQVFPDLTVRENIAATAANRAGNDAPWSFDRVIGLFPRLGERVNQYARSLSGGEQQMLAIGRALATNPVLMILDEATEGLAPMIREEIWTVLETGLKKAGQAILVIDKHPEAMARLADHHYIMKKGKIVWSGSSDEMRADESIHHSYLGV